MSFKDLKTEELLEVCAGFAVEVSDKAKKPEIIAALAEEGVTYEMYVSFRDADREEPELKDEEGSKDNDIKEEIKEVGGTSDKVLVKMERENPRYEVAGKVFTKAHPFVVMSSDEAQQVFDAVEGFRVATPREAQEFYS